MARQQPDQSRDRRHRSKHPERMPHEFGGRDRHRQDQDKDGCPGHTARRSRDRIRPLCEASFLAAFIVRLSGCENPAVGPTKNWRISPCGTGPWLRFFEVPPEGRLQPLSCNSEVLGARSESSRALQDSAMPSRASPSTLVHLDPECRPRPHLPRYSGSNLCDSLSDRRLFLPAPSGSPSRAGITGERL